MKILNHTGQVLLFAFFFFISFLLPAQKNGEFILIGSVLENEIVKLDGVTVTVYEDNEKVFDTIASRKGKFEITLKMNSDYIVEFGKPGYVSKSISVSTDPPKACTVRKWEHDIGTEVSLFKYVSGVNYSMYKRPIAYFEFTDKCSFEKDEAFAKTVFAIQNKVRDDVTKAQKEVAKSSDQENKLKEEQEKQKQMDEKYKQLIAFADEEFKDKNFENASQIYTEALKLKPNQLYPETQLIKMRGILAEIKLAKEKAAQQELAVAKKKMEAEQSKTEAPKVAEVIVPKTNSSGNEDLKKTEKQTEALLHRLTDVPPFNEANAQLEKQREIDRGYDLKSILAHTNAKRIFLEEIADSKVKMKQQKSMEIITIQ